MFTFVFLKDAGERALKTVAQVLLSLWVVGDAFNVLEANWTEAFGIAAGAAVISVLTSVISAGAVKDTVGPASLVTADPDDLP